MVLLLLFVLLLLSLIFHCCLITFDPVACTTRMNTYSDAALHIASDSAITFTVAPARSIVINRFLNPLYISMYYYLLIPMFIPMLLLLLSLVFLYSLITFDPVAFMIHMNNYSDADVRVDSDTAIACIVAPAHSINIAHISMYYYLLIPMFIPMLLLLLFLSLLLFEYSVGSNNIAAVQ